MDPRQAEANLELIRTLMERTVQYQLLTARAGLAAGALALLGAGSFFFLDRNDPAAFGAVWGVVFVGALAATCIGTARRSRQVGEPVWSRQARAVVLALTPSLFAALVLTVFFFHRGDGAHLYLPGIWMLCYGQGALATSAYAPTPIRGLGIASLLAGAATLWLGPDWAIVMMAAVFGVGHMGLGVALMLTEQRTSPVAEDHPAAGGPHWRETAESR
jgi:hypothetical protein